MCELGKRRQTVSRNDVRQALLSALGQRFADEQLSLIVQYSVLSAEELSNLAGAWYAKVAAQLETAKDAQNSSDAGSRSGDQRI